MKIKVLIPLIFIIAAAALTIVSFSTTWYYEKIETSGTKVEAYYKYNKVKTVRNIGGTTTTETRGYTKDEINGMEAQMKFYKAALAMDILAFVNLFFASIALGVATFKDISPANATRLKNSLNSALVFTIIACFVFLGLPKARREDCQDGGLGAFGTCDFDLYKKFYGSTDQLFGSFEWGPHTSWITVTIAMGICFFTSIYVYIAGVN